MVAMAGAAMASGMAVIGMVTGKEMDSTGALGGPRPCRLSQLLSSEASLP